MRSAASDRGIALGDDGIAFGGNGIAFGDRAVAFGTQRITFGDRRLARQECRVEIGGGRRPCRECLFERAQCLVPFGEGVLTFGDGGITRAFGGRDRVANMRGARVRLGIALAGRGKGPGMFGDRGLCGTHGLAQTCDGRALGFQLCDRLGMEPFEFGGPLRRAGLLVCPARRCSLEIADLLPEFLHRRLQRVPLISGGLFQLRARLSF